MNANQITIEEGCKCPECGDGTMEYPRVENCSCHLCAPCSACVDNRIKCDDCGFEEPEPEPLPSLTKEQEAYWAEERKRWEESRSRGHKLPGGGRIYNCHHDGSSGSTMVWTGQYEGEVTAKEIRDHFGDGTFGHRGPTISGGRFTYTLITD